MTLKREASTWMEQAGGIWLPETLMVTKCLDYFRWTLYWQRNGLFFFFFPKPLQSGVF